MEIKPYIFTERQGDVHTDRHGETDISPKLGDGMVKQANSENCGLPRGNIIVLEVGQRSRSWHGAIGKVFSQGSCMPIMNALPLQTIGTKNTNLVEDVEDLFPVKFRQNPFSGCGEEVEKCFSQPEARAAILDFRSAQKTQT